MEWSIVPFSMCTPPPCTFRPSALLCQTRQRESFMRYNNLEKFLSSIEQGKLCTGCCITCTDPAITEIAAEAGFDFCWIDGEHGVMDRNTAMSDNIWLTFYVLDHSSCFFPCRNYVGCIRCKPIPLERDYLFCLPYFFLLKKKTPLRLSLFILYIIS